jgi:hypothetical protein
MRIRTVVLVPLFLIVVSIGLWSMQLLELWGRWVPRVHVLLIYSRQRYNIALFGSGIRFLVCREGMLFFYFLVVYCLECCSYD